MLDKKQMREFFERLSGPEGSNCQGGRDKTQAREILKLMGIPFSVRQDFLYECEKAGGFCDCEIISNARETLLEQLRNDGEFQIDVSD